MNYDEILMIAEERKRWNGRVAARLKRIAEAHGNEQSAVKSLRTDLQRALESNQFWVEHHKDEPQKAAEYMITVGVIREILATMDDAPQA